MKEPKLTKKELATQTRDLDEQIIRLKNRLNGQAFKKTKHGFRLDQLSEGAQQMRGRIGGLEQQLAGLSQAQNDLAAQWQALRKATDTLENPPKETGGKKRLKEKLGRLKSSVTSLSQQQEQISKSLGELQNAVGRVGNVRDDLKLETDELRAHTRNLEENSSRLSVNQSAQEERTRELEGLLAELTLRHENLASEEKTVAESLPRLDEAIAPLTEQVQQLSQFAAEESGKHKEVDRRLQELGNRIGDLGGRFNHLSLDIADQRQQREPLKQEQDPQLQKLEAQNSSIDTLETQLGATLQRETDALWQKLEEKEKDVDSLREQLEALSAGEQSPEFERKLSGVEAEVNRLSEAEDFLQESFRGIGGLELNLTSRLDNLQQQLQGHIERSREYEDAMQRLSGEFADISGNLQQLEQADLRHQGSIEALLQKQALSSERELDAESHRQEVDGQLDRIEESFTAERERLTQLEENFSLAGDQSEAQRDELEQTRLLQQELQSRLDDLNEDFASQTSQSGSLTARVENQERQQQTLSDRLDAQLEQQSALINEGQSVKQLLSELEQREQQSASQSAVLEQEQRALRQQLETEKPGMEEHTQTLQALAGDFDTLGARVAADQPRIENIERYGKTNRIALIALFLLALLGGAALYFSNMGRIAESEQQIASKLITSDPDYIAREDLVADKLKALESGLANNGGRIDEVAAALPLQSLQERQTELEQQLARFEAQLNLVSAGTQENSATGENPVQLQTPDLEPIQREIERINSALIKLSAQPASAAGEARSAAVESRLGNTIDQLGVRISQLEAERPDPGLSRIAGFEQTLSETSDQLGVFTDQLVDQQNSIMKIERSLSDTRRVFGERLNALETDTADTKKISQQLKNQVQALTDSREPSDQKVVSPDQTDAAAIWQAAADAHWYAIQLAGSRSRSSLIAFASSESLQGDTAYFRAVHEGRDWYILLYGRYSSFKDATNTLNNLPSSLNRYSPWIRTIPRDATFVPR